ncbi:MAG: DUF1824 family protein [Cyanobacteria bacterium P01_E01_bin.34]
MTSPIMQARTLLKRFDCTDKPAIPDAEQSAVQAALRTIVAEADFLTLGVCADTYTAGFSALKTYLQALGLVETEASPEDSAIAGPAYIKCNTESGKHYASDYPGPARGVLICCHVYEPAFSSEMYGHLPLDLFG